jgi:AcrR family transcriptional regulator
MDKPKATSEARLRILDTADQLFYREGIRSVGIDRIIAEAKVAKMTLYAHFPSKDELILAVLQHREEKMIEFFRSAIERHSQRNKDKFRAFFASLKELLERPGFRGCPFQNAAAELSDHTHPGFEFVQAQKKRFAAVIGKLITESIGKADARTISAVVMLVEGAIVNAVIHGTPESADIARDAALQLLKGY